MTESLDRDPIVLLHDVARIMRTRFDQRARSRDMTRAQWHILARVERQPGLSQRELATICEVEPITIARLVDRLEQRGLLERRPDPDDRRVWRLHNLPSARPILDEINAYREELIANIDAEIGLDARASLVKALLAIRSQLASGADEVPPATSRTGKARITRKTTKSAMDRAPRRKTDAGPQALQQTVRRP